MELSKDIENVPQTQIDNRMAKSKPVKLGWSTEEIDNISRVLNELLGDAGFHQERVARSQGF